MDVRELESGSPVGIPIAVRISGEEIGTFRRLANELKDLLRARPDAARVRDDWGAESFTMRLLVDPDRANMAGVTNLDVAASSIAAMNGLRVGTPRDGSDQIPIVARTSRSSSYRCCTRSSYST